MNAKRNVDGKHDKGPSPSPRYDSRVTGENANLLGPKIEHAVESAVHHAVEPLRQCLVSIHAQIALLRKKER